MPAATDILIDILQKQIITNSAEHGAVPVLLYNPNHDKLGRFAPKPGGKWNKTNSKEEAAIYKAVLSLRDEPIEYGIAIDSNGKTLVKKKGEEYRISYTNEENDKKFMTTVIHNHPGAGPEIAGTTKKQPSTFSSQDLQAAAYDGCKQIIVVSQGEVFRIRPRGRPPTSSDRRSDMWGWPPNAAKKFNEKQIREGMRSLHRKWNNSPEGKYTEDEWVKWQLDLHHNSLKKTAKKFDWEYTRETIKEPGKSMLDRLIGRSEPLVLHYNPNHDKLGRFAPKPGGKGSTLKMPDDIRKFENFRRHETNEWGTAFDANGRFIHEKMGEEKSLHYTRQEYEQFKGGKFTHNHPGKDLHFSFSGDDINAHRTFETKEYRCTNEDGIDFAMGRPKNWRSPGAYGIPYYSSRIRAEESKLDDLTDWLIRRKKKYADRDEGWGFKTAARTSKVLDDISHSDKMRSYIQHHAMRSMAKMYNFPYRMEKDGKILRQWGDWSEAEKKSLILQYNPNHDKLGRFAPKPGGKGSSIKMPDIDHIRDIENNHRNRSVETGTIYKANGNLGIIKRGDENAIGWTGDEIALAQDGTFTHNHPSKDYTYSFSGGDFEFHVKAGTKEFRATTRSGIDFSMGKTTNNAYLPYYHLSPFAAYVGVYRQKNKKLEELKKWLQKREGKQIERDKKIGPNTFQWLYTATYDEEKFKSKIQHHTMRQLAKENQFPYRMERDGVVIGEWGVPKQKSLVLHYNPNHDKLGRFAPKPGGKSSGGLKMPRDFEVLSAQKRGKVLRDLDGQWDGARKDIAEAAIMDYDSLRSSKGHGVYNVLLGSTKKELLGVIGYTQYPKSVEINWLATKRTGEGHGRDMMTAIAQVAARKNKFLELTSYAEARGFYEKLGMENTRGSRYELSPAKTRILSFGEDPRKVKKSWEEELTALEPLSGIYVTRNEEKSLVLQYNPNHDKLGRFAPKPGGKAIGLKQPSQNPTFVPYATEIGRIKFGGLSDPTKREEAVRKEIKAFEEKYRGNEIEHGFLLNERRDEAIVVKGDKNCVNISPQQKYFIRNGGSLSHTHPDHEGKPLLGFSAGDVRVTIADNLGQVDAIHSREKRFVNGEDITLYRPKRGWTYAHDNSPMDRTEVSLIYRAMEKDQSARLKKMDRWIENRDKNEGYIKDRDFSIEPKTAVGQMRKRVYIEGFRWGYHHVMRDLAHGIGVSYELRKDGKVRYRYNKDEQAKLTKDDLEHDRFVFRSKAPLVLKYNPNHDKLGRFAPNPGGKASGVKVPNYPIGGPSVSRPNDADRSSLKGIHYWKDEYRDSPVEVAMYYDKNDKLIGFKMGNEYSVGFSAKECRAMKGGSLAHTHPASFKSDSESIPASFSSADVFMAANRNHKISYASVPRSVGGFDYVMVRPGRGWTDPRTGKNVGGAGLARAYEKERKTLVKRDREIKAWAQARENKSINKLTGEYLPGYHGIGKDILRGYERPHPSLRSTFEMYHQHHIMRNLADRYEFDYRMQQNNGDIIRNWNKKKRLPEVISPPKPTATQLPLGLSLTLKYNPNHDKLGRFAPKPGGKASGLKQPVEIISGGIETLPRWEKGIRGLDVEHGIGFDEKGNFGFRVVGTNNRINLSEEQVNLLRNGTFTHNHPNQGQGIDGGSFSDLDLALFAGARVKELRAVSGKYDHSIKPSAELAHRLSFDPYYGPNPRQQFKDEMYAKYAAREAREQHLIARAFTKIARGKSKMDPRALLKSQFEHETHHIVRNLSKEMGFEYSRTPIAVAKSLVLQYNPYHDKLGRFAPKPGGKGIKQPRFPGIDKLKDYERDIRHQPVEYGVAFNSYGDFIVKKRGTPDGLYFTGDELARMRGGTLTHWHPDVRPGLDGGSFSKPDVHTTLTSDIGTVRALSGKYNYTLKRTTNTPPSYTQEGGQHILKTMSDYDRNDRRERRLIERAERKIATGKSNFDPRRLEALVYEHSTHHIMRNIAKANKLDYTREPYREEKSLVLLYNPNHDKLGRFAPAPGGKAAKTARQFKDNQEFYDWGTKHFGEAAKEIDDRARVAVGVYNSRAYAGINFYNRNKETFAKMSPKDYPPGLSLGFTGRLGAWYYKRVSDNLDRAFNAKLPEDITVFRTDSRFYRNTNRLKPRVGQVLHDKGFLSTTSLDLSTSTYGHGELWVLRIRAPKGKPAVFMPAYSPRKDANENEVLFPRDTKMRVTKITPLDPKKKQFSGIIDTEVLL